MIPKDASVTAGGVFKITKTRSRRLNKASDKQCMVSRSAAAAAAAALLADENAGIEDDTIRGVFVLKKRVLSRFGREQRSKAADAAAVAAARQERAKLEEQRQRDMQALRASHQAKERARADPAPPRGGSLPKAAKAALAAHVPMTPRQIASVAAAMPPVARGSHAADEGGVDVPGGLCESCADGGDVGDEAREEAGLLKDASAKFRKRPRDEAQGSMAFLPLKTDCIQDTASTPSADVGGACAAPTSFPPQPTIPPPVTGPKVVPAARVVPCEVEGENISQRVDLALFSDAEALMVGLQRLFPSYDRDEMKLVYLDDEQDCMAVSEYTPWVYFATTATKLMLIPS